MTLNAVSLTLFTGLLFFTHLSQAQSAPRKRVFLPSGLDEVSGMVRNPDGTLWMHNDSRNSSDLFLFNPATGKMDTVVRLPVPNRDWEELCTDGNGRLFIGDFGNNGNARLDLRIYLYRPDDGSLDSLLFHFPDQVEFPPQNTAQRRFDCEAMVFRNDSLHLFTKHRFDGNGISGHYVLPAKPGTYTAELRDSLYFHRSVITGAALSPDGQTLALTTYYGRKWLGFWPVTRGRIWINPNFAKMGFTAGPWTSRRLPKCLYIRQYESIVWLDARHWIVANEKRPPHRAAIRRIRVKASATVPGTPR